MIRAKLEVNTARLKKLVLLAQVSAASRVSTASRVSNASRTSAMSSASTVTYIFVYTDSEPGRPIAPPSLDYVPGPEHPPSPDYVPGPEHPPSPVEVPYVPEPEYPEYLAPSDVEAPLEDQPLPTDASPTALSPGYVADSDSDEDPEEDPEEDHADYPTDGGDDDDEPSDDDDTNEEDEEPSKDEDDDEDEEEHLALADSFAVPVVDPVPSIGVTKAFENDESAPTPRSPQTKVPFTQTRLRKARNTVRLKPPMSPSMEARIAKYVAAPTQPSLLPSPLSPWSPPLSQIPSSPLPPLPVSLFIPPPVNHREDIPKTELPPCKRLCPTVPTLRFIGTMDAKIKCQRAEEVGYGIRDVYVDPTEAVEEVAPTTLEGVNARVTELAVDSYPDTGLPHRLIGVTDDDIDCTGFITTGIVISGIRTDSGTSG
ncbi:hypothetical protein Tco_1524825 [Tanacetum coccineum]